MIVQHCIHNRVLNNFFIETKTFCELAAAIMVWSRCSSPNLFHGLVVVFVAIRLSLKKLTKTKLKKIGRHKSNALHIATSTQINGFKIRGCKG